MSTRTEDRTGVEMEALTGATMAAMTIYDMCKAVDRGMIIGDIRLLEKTGGKEDYVRDEPDDQRAEPAPGAGSARTTGLPSGAVVTVNVSAAKGERKKSVPEVVLREGHGISG